MAHLVTDFETKQKLPARLPQFFFTHFPSLEFKKNVRWMTNKILGNRNRNLAWNGMISISVLVMKSDIKARMTNVSRLQTRLKII